MKKINSLPAVLCTVFVVVCLQVSASGQSAQDNNNFAAISGSGSNVRWDVNGPYSSLTMTVSAPDGRVFRKEFKAGTSPEFTVIDKNGERLPDGQYTYELRLTPIFSPGVTEELAAARAREYAPESASDMSKRGAMSESLVQKEDAADTLRAMRKRGLLPAEPQVKSGGFSVLNGAVVVPGGVEEGQPRPEEPRPTRKGMELSRLLSIPPGGALRKVKQHHPFFSFIPDQVIPDDLIVQGSACVGLDCVNGEVFDFDTIRMKENNTRLQFLDTSTSAGFPSNNWQLRANDSASGGNNFLGFVDQGLNGTSESGTLVLSVRAGAPANSILVDSTGRLGLRTATPVLDIHTNTSNTPAIRLEQNSSGGFTAQTWDIGANEANFFVRDVTGGSRLPFRIRPGAPTSSIDIAASGNVGIGTASPKTRLDVKQAEDGFIGGLHLRRATTNDTWAIVTGSDNNLYLGYATDASLGDSNADFSVNPLILTTTNRVGIGTAAPDQKLSVNGDASKVGGGSWLVFSDERLKNIKGNFNSGLKAVMQLQPLRYEYKRDNALGLKSSGEHIGFGAHALQKIIPEAVTSTSTGYLQVNNDPIIWTMLNAIKEQQKEIEQLKGQIQKLRSGSRRRK